MRLPVALVTLVVGSAPLAGQAPAGSARAAESAKVSVLWSKLELAVAIKYLTDGLILLLHADEVMPTASTIKTAILAELFRQQSGGGGGAGLAGPDAVDSAGAVRAGE